MLRKTLAVVMISAATALAACATGPTPYQMAAGYERGYSEQKIEYAR